jgi:hypothetical protein
MNHALNFTSTLLIDQPLKLLNVFYIPFGWKYKLRTSVDSRYDIRE